MNKVLSRIEAEALLSGVNLARKQSTIKMFKREEWPSNQDKLFLLQAAEKGEQTVKFTDGRVFMIKYKDYPMVYVKPVDEMLPCGWFNIDSLKNEIGMLI